MIRATCDTHVTWAGICRHGSFARTADEPVMKATKSEAITAITDRKQSELKLILIY